MLESRGPKMTAGLMRERFLTAGLACAVCVSSAVGHPAFAGFYPILQAGAFFGSAEKTLRLAIELESDAVSLKTRRKNPAKAERTAKEAAQLLTNLAFQNQIAEGAAGVSAEAAFMLGLSAEEAGGFKKAADWYKHSLSFHSNEGFVSGSARHIYWSSKAVGVFPIPSPRVHSALRLAYLYQKGLIETKNNHSALETADQFYESAYKGGADALLIGMIQEKIHGDFQRAAGWYNRIDPLPRYRLARCFAKSGDYERAEKLYLDIIHDRKTEDADSVSKAALRLGFLSYTWRSASLPSAPARDRREKARRFYNIAVQTGKDPLSVALTAAKTHQKIWERSRSAEDLSFLIERYRAAVDAGFSQTSYNEKMAELFLLTAAGDACRIEFKNGWGSVSHPD